ncbi:MAG: hypothetical protein D6737_16325 [Chloroflexi bacterium]|nr:MAG: hypothetical protein D6737_16325 [Chloroflexota bacterium]
MVEENNTTHTPDNQVPEPAHTYTADSTGTEDVPDTAPPPASPESVPEANSSEAAMDERLERLGGEPAPVITPEEFARLQKAGQVHIDSRGRIRTARPSDAEGGVSLRKRRAWYMYI